MDERQHRIKFDWLKVEHAPEVARLHIQGISTGFISSLGINFVTALYEILAQSRTSFGFVAEEGDSILGFVAFTKNLNNLYKSVILRKGFRLAFLIVGKISSLSRLKKVFETLLYPSRTKKMNLPSAELLSTVIAPEGRRKGLATQLLQKSFLECQKRGIDNVKVLVGAANEPANKLYLKCGFEFVGQIESHGVISNIYIANTGKKRIDEEIPKSYF